MLAKLAICAWSLYLGADLKTALPAAKRADLKARAVAVKEKIVGAWAAMAKAKASQAASNEQAGKVKLIAVEKSVVEATNAQRAQYGLPPLEVDDELMKTARDHCAWMTNYQTLQHTGLPVAENIAMGQQSTEHVLGAWMGSPGHRANILNGAFRRIGVAAYRTPGGVIFWCQQFRRN